MTEPLTPQWSHRTLTAGAIGFIGNFLVALSFMITSMPTGVGIVGLLLAACGHAMNGWVARDDVVSSEGHVAAKDRK